MCYGISKLVTKRVNVSPRWFELYENMVSLVWGLFYLFVVFDQIGFKFFLKITLLINWINYCQRGKNAVC